MEYRQLPSLKKFSSLTPSPTPVALECPSPSRITDILDLKIGHLRNSHAGKAAFCLGSAPHLNNLDLSLLKDQIVIGCNQLSQLAGKLDFNYMCFHREKRFQQSKEWLKKNSKVKWVIPEHIFRKNAEWFFQNKLVENTIIVNSRHTTSGHAEYFSFDLANCVYAGDIIEMQIQLAVWMGCNPIYVLGVDAEFNPEKPFFDDTQLEDSHSKHSKHHLPELKQWLSKVRTMLWARGIKLYNAAGPHSSLTALPKMRYECALGKPKIAVTSKTFSKDEYLVGELKRYFPEVKLNNEPDSSLSGDKLIEFLSDVDGAVLGTEPLSAEVMEKLPCLRYVSKYGVGLNNFDFNAAKEHQIEIAYQKGVNSDSVAELCLAFAIMLLRNIDTSIGRYRNERWAKVPGKELAETNLGIIGYGHVGRVTAQKFAALGIGRLLVNDLLDFPVSTPAEFVSLDYLLEHSDIVSLHISSLPKNIHFANEDFFKKMKPGSYLINTARGDILSEKALIEALNSGHLAGAALDVYENEPTPNSELTNIPNLLTSCHIAGSSNRAIKNMGWASIEGLLRLLGRQP